ncbi:hypothetical protein ACOME3_000180 [Neoechinorhynchus agilis]
MDAKTSQSFSVDQANFKFCHKLRSNEENPSETDVYVTPKVHDNDDIIPEVGRFRRFIQNRILVREKFKHAKVSNQNGDVALNHEDEKNITELEGLETIYDGFY